ncbi:hypothetical protein E2C01_006503 [Portunus trituberculatus]|uniref:Uncharacterized protein n=1 Tax=Portunus trituberculatus TaxID=210409 RepID=A0A5B7CX15_PORTR|nr:hypothetical protein [Portunus trituberculatus]
MGRLAQVVERPGGDGGCSQATHVHVGGPCTAWPVVYQTQTKLTISFTLKMKKINQNASSLANSTILKLKIWKKMKYDNNLQKHSNETDIARCHQGCPTCWVECITSRRPGQGPPLAHSTAAPTAAAAAATHQEVCKVEQPGHGELKHHVWVTGQPEDECQEGAIGSKERPQLLKLTRLSRACDDPQSPAYAPLDCGRRGLYKDAFHRGPEDVAGILGGGLRKYPCHLFTPGGHLRLVQGCLQADLKGDSSNRVEDDDDDDDDDDDNNNNNNKNLT